MPSSTMPSRVLLDGVGCAAMAVLPGIADLWRIGDQIPVVALRDSGAWRRKHAEAGLVDDGEVDLPKAEVGRRLLLDAGWPLDRISADGGDVRDRPRSFYRSALCLALTDSHACKSNTITKALQAGSPAISIGLGAGEAIVECFVPGGACYGCVHGSDGTWRLKRPCEPASTVSTTEVAWRPSSGTVLAAGRLAAEIVRCHLEGTPFHGDRGAQLADGTPSWFHFDQDPTCEGPHDTPFDRDAENVLRVPERPDRVVVSDLLGRIGAGAIYADRPLTWNWGCPLCEKTRHVLHTIHPAAACPACGALMEAALEQVSGLTGREVEELNGGEPKTLASLGLAEETILRCAAADGGLIWVHLDCEERQP